MGNDIYVLVVDDEEEMRKLLSTVLEREGYKVSVASDVAEARTLLSQSVFHVVISDIQMPGESGYDLLKYIKQSSPEIGVILMTGHGDIYSVKDAMLLGAEEYVTKPFKTFEIAVLVDRVYWRMRSPSCADGATTKINIDDPNEGSSAL